MPAHEEEKTLALAHFQKGKNSLDKGDLPTATQFFRKALALNPALPQGHLCLATACLGLGEDLEACAHLRIFLGLEPDNVLVRQNFADLLLRLERFEEARQQFEQFIRDVQPMGGLANRHLIHCHSRLMFLGEQAEDRYRETLHRGIGLYLLALENAGKEKDAAPGETKEALLFRAAGELTQARMLRSDLSRPCWYLFLVWDSLARNRPAHRWLTLATQDSPAGDLTPAEFQELHLALLARETDHIRK